MAVIDTPEPTRSTRKRNIETASIVMLRWQEIYMPRRKTQLGYLFVDKALHISSKAPELVEG